MSQKNQCCANSKLVAKNKGLFNDLSTQQLTVGEIISCKACIDVDALCYVPCDPSDWNPPPTTIKEAVDRLADIISDTHGTIPICVPGSP